MGWLHDIRVVDFSSGIAGPYCTKLFADAGADVIKVEAPGGDYLRRWSAGGNDLREGDGAFFRFLNAGKRSVIGHPADHEILDLVSSADLVVDDLPIGIMDALRLTERLPALVWLSITAFGRGGPWQGRPASEFTLQAESGSIGCRGRPDAEPVQIGGRMTEWVAGAMAAVPALAAVFRARRTGHGGHIDVSLLEVLNIGFTSYLDLFSSLLGRPEPTAPMRNVETPSVEPTADGWVGFCTNSGQQFRDFLVLIERPDLFDDAELANVYGRIGRYKEWSEVVRAWTTKHTTAEIIERAAALRIPVAPVNNGDTVRGHEHLVARGVFVRDATNTFTHPRAPYAINGLHPSSNRPAPRLGEHGAQIELPLLTKQGAQGRSTVPGSTSPDPSLVRRGTSSEPIAEQQLPLVGLRILDLTNWWAGPSATHVLGMLGAEVIHVESIQRPDGMRFLGGAYSMREQWWEYSQVFLAANANKKGLTLNLSDPAGRAVLKRLIAVSDALVENFSPRVLEQFGFGWERVHTLNPRAIMARMPAFGLSGPWRDHVGFAQTMEQMTGLAWINGHPEQPPLVQRGPCDPFAGMHAAFALLVAWALREATGEGQHVEVPMVECALNAAAEQVIEFTAYGQLLERSGNRSPGVAPQGLYPCRGSEQWLALTIANDAQWQALKGVMGNPSWAEDPAFESLTGRWREHDRIDQELKRWTGHCELADIVDQLTRAGIPAGSVTEPRATSRDPQLAARGYFETCTHPVVGTHPIPSVPFRLAGVERWIRSPAPTLGEHNRTILREMLGMSDAEIAALEAKEVIGTFPKGL